jgi:8-oxo-dGTP pyrophosphatase MutT (NUDIX family)
MNSTKINHYFEDINKRRNLTGARITTAYIICKIKNQYYVLTHKRSAVMTHPLEYSGPGGSIDSGESSYNAILREIKEETGFTVEKDGYLFLTPSGGKNKTNNYICGNYVFFCTEEEIKNGVKGPLDQYKIEIDGNATFNDLEDIILLPNTGHCLMNIGKNINHPKLYHFFNENLKHIFYKCIKKF